MAEESIPEINKLIKAFGKDFQKHVREANKEMEQLSKSLEKERMKMIRTVNVNHNVEIEDYYLLRGVSDNPGFGKKVKSEKEFDHNPTVEEIAGFLVESEADFASIEHNYRLYKDNELPFM